MPTIQALRRPEALGEAAGALNASPFTLIAPTPVFSSPELPNVPWAGKKV
jgi:hypothetical protein